MTKPILVVIQIPQPSVREQLAASVGRIAAAVDTLAATLGIPGKAVVTVEPQDDSQADTGEAWDVRLQVNDRLVDIGSVLMMQAYHLVFGDWAENRYDLQLPRFGDLPQTVDFLVELITAAIKRQPAALLTPAHSALIAGDESETAHAVFASLLELSIPLTPAEPILEALRTGGTAQQIREMIVSKRITRTIEVEIAPSYLEKLMTPAWDDLHAWLQEGMTTELGIWCPVVTFVPNEQLEPDRFAIRLNGVAQAAQRGIPEGMLLVNDTPSRLRLMNVTAQPWMNPATYQPGAITGADQRDMLEAAGLTVWDVQGYVILAIGAHLRRNSHAMIDRDIAGMLLDEIAPTTPVAARLGRDKLDTLLDTMRGLLIEGVGCRNLRAIVEGLVDHDLLAERLPVEQAPLETVRRSMSRIVVSKATSGSTTLVAYLLDQEIEARLLAKPTSAETAGILHAIRAEMTYLPVTAQAPHFLTLGETRPLLAQLIRYEFPTSRVLAYEELPPMLNIQPVARISLGS